MGYEYMVDIINDLSPRCVIQKAAQMGATVAALLQAFWNLDQRKVSTLYLLPNQADASDFSAGRVTPLIESSEHLTKMFDDVSNVGHKRAGTLNLYVRGSNSRSRLKNIPVGHLVIDEFDEMHRGVEDSARQWDAVSMARERMSGQETKTELDLSTPSVPDTGINAEWKGSQQQHYHWQCGACGKWVRFEWPDSIEWIEGKPETARRRCTACKAPLTGTNHGGKWIADYPDRILPGWHLSQMFSPTVSPAEIVAAFEGAQGKEFEFQEFHNSKLGLPYVAKGARVSAEDIAACVDQNRVIGTWPGDAPQWMGIDVGARIHWEAATWDGTRKVVLGAGEVEDFDALGHVIRERSPVAYVIDANPETRQARALIETFRQGWMCYYPAAMREIIVPNADQRTVNAHRTATLDITLGRFRTGPNAVSLPRDLPQSYGIQIAAPVRRLLKDRTGNYVGRYVETGPDHYAHAANYCEVAHGLVPHAVAPMATAGVEDGGAVYHW